MCSTPLELLHLWFLCLIILVVCSLPGGENTGHPCSFFSTLSLPLTSGFRLALYCMLLLLFQRSESIRPALNSPVERPIGDQEEGETSAQVKAVHKGREWYLAVAFILQLSFMRLRTSMEMKALWTMLVLKANKPYVVWSLYPKDYPRPGGGNSAPLRLVLALRNSSKDKSAMALGAATTPLENNSASFSRAETIELLSPHTSLTQLGSSNSF